MSAPTAADFNELLWYVSRWSALHEGYGIRLQTAIERAVPDCDQSALNEAARYPYLGRPTEARLDALHAEYEATA